MASINDALDKSTQTYSACIHAHVHMHMHMYTCTCTCTHAHVHVYMHMYTCTCTCTHAHVHMHMYKGEKVPWHHLHVGIDKIHPKIEMKGTFPTSGDGGSSNCCCCSPPSHTSCSTCLATTITTQAS